MLGKTKNFFQMRNLKSLDFLELQKTNAMPALKQWRHQESQLEWADWEFFSASDGALVSFLCTSGARSSRNPHPPV